MPDKIFWFYIDDNKDHVIVSYPNFKIKPDPDFFRWIDAGDFIDVLVALQQIVDKNKKHQQSIDNFHLKKTNLVKASLVSLIIIPLFFVTLFLFPDYRFVYRIFVILTLIYGFALVWYGIFLERFDHRSMKQKVFEDLSNIYELQNTFLKNDYRTNGLNRVRWKILTGSTCYYGATLTINIQQKSFV